MMQQTDLAPLFSSSVGVKARLGLLPVIPCNAVHKFKLQSHIFGGLQAGWEVTANPESNLTEKNEIIGSGS